MIYLVEDDPSIRKLVSYALSNNGFEVQSFENGEDMFKLLSSIKPELFLLDIMLPGLSGLEILAKLKSESEALKNENKAIEIEKRALATQLEVATTKTQKNTTLLQIISCNFPPLKNVKTELKTAYHETNS